MPPEGRYRNPQATPIVPIGLGIVEFLDRRLVWFELLADPNEGTGRETRLPSESSACVSSI